MSAIGEKTAVISIGMSCQSAHQIRANIKTLQAALGDETLTPKSLPFDWLICPPLSAMSILSDPVRLPARDEMAMNSRPFWMKKNAYFWHHFRNDKKEYDLDSSYDDTLAIYRGRWERFKHLEKATTKRTICVLSNTQNDLSLTEATVGTVSSLFRASELKLLADEVQTHFARKLEFIVVTRPDRYISDVTLNDMKLYMHEPDSSAWEGDDAQWANTFRKALR